MIASKSISHRPIPTGCYMSLSRAPLTLPAGWAPSNAWPEPILTVPAAPEPEDTYPATLAEMHTSDRRNAWASIACILVVAIAGVVLALFLRR